MPLPKPQRLTVREVTDLLAQVVDDATSSAGLHEFLAGSFKKTRHEAGLAIICLVLL